MMVVLNKGKINNKRKVSTMLMKSSMVPHKSMKVCRHSEILISLRTNISIYWKIKTRSITSFPTVNNPAFLKLPST